MRFIPSILQYMQLNKFVRSSPGLPITKRSLSALTDTMYDEIKIRHWLLMVYL